MRSWLLAFVLALLPAAVAAAPCGGDPYRGPLIDAMSQMDGRIDGPAAIKVARANGVVGLALFARSGEKHEGDGLVADLARLNPGFVIPGSAKRFDMRKDLDAAYVDATLAAVGQHKALFVGEILYSHGDKAAGEQTAAGERRIDPLGPETTRLLAKLAGRVPVMTHWEVYDWERDWPRFDRLYGQFPRQVFIWPHAGFGSADQLATVLAAHPNVWATLSKKDAGVAGLADADKAEATGPAILDESGCLRPEWRAVIEMYKDRLVFATDAHKDNRWKHYGAIVVRWRGLLGQLAPAVAEAIAYRNAERLYGVRPVGG